MTNREMKLEIEIDVLTAALRELYVSNPANMQEAAGTNDMQKTLQRGFEKYLSRLIIDSIELAKTQLEAPLLAEYELRTTKKSIK